MCACASACDSDRLEILPTSGEGDGEGLLDIRKASVILPRPMPMRCADEERVEVRVDVGLVLLKLERPLDELLGARRVAASV